MAYRSYPRLELRGMVAEEEVHGQAWLDHQWGGFGWLLMRSSQHLVLGWDWFGINLDDGSDWIILIHRNMKNRRIIACSALVRREGKSCLFKCFSAEPLRYWESPLTHIRYPVAWRIRIPEIGADLLFQPLADGQEIQAFGILRAVWEGAGRVSGYLAERPVSGRARLELHGYGYIYDFHKFLKRFTRRVDRLIEDFLPKAIDEGYLDRYLGSPHWTNDASVHTKMFSEPIWDLISRTGKRWRPLYCIMMLEALGVPSKPYEMLAAIIAELSHTGSLIIDDIEDDSTLRRGEECIHLRYGLDVAINAGSSLYFLPYLLLPNHPHLDEGQRLELYRIMIRQSVRAHFGQGLDIYWSKYLNVKNLRRWMKDSLGPKILQMYAYKTAAPIEGLAENACVIARSDRETKEACVFFSRALGVAFQIVDDVDDFEDPPNGKTLLGEDLASGKLTYVIFHALKGLKGSDRNRLMEILCSNTMKKHSPLLDEGIDLVRSSGALPRCREEALGLIEKEWIRLSRRIPPSDPKMMFRMLCWSLINHSWVPNGGLPHVP